MSSLVLGLVLGIGIPAIIIATYFVPNGKSDFTADKDNKRSQLPDTSNSNYSEVNKNENENENENEIDDDAAINDDEIQMLNYGNIYDGDGGKNKKSKKNKSKKNKKSNKNKKSKKNKKAKKDKKL